MEFKYDFNNIFAKILKKEIPNDTVIETKHSLAFKDINPQAPTHVLIIPKSKYCSFADFTVKAGAEEQRQFFNSINEIAVKLNLLDGYRLITNVGRGGGQEVPHFHFHLLSGKNIGKLVP